MQLEIGMVLDGKIKGITKFGAFVDLGEGLSGMVHISEISSRFVKEVKDFLTEGQNVRVKVININENGKVGLSIKKVEESSFKDEKNEFRKKPKMNAGWKGLKKLSEPKDFEDMLSKFKQSSEERISGLKKANESRRSGFSRYNGRSK